MHRKAVIVHPWSATMTFEIRHRISCHWFHGGTLLDPGEVLLLLQNRVSPLMCLSILPVPGAGAGGVGPFERLGASTGNTLSTERKT